MKKGTLSINTKEADRILSNFRPGLAKYGLKVNTYDKEVTLFTTKKNDDYWDIVDDEDCIFGFTNDRAEAEELFRTLTRKEVPMKTTKATKASDLYTTPSGVINLYEELDAASEFESACRLDEELKNIEMSQRAKVSSLEIKLQALMYDLIEHGGDLCEQFA